MCRHSCRREFHTELLQACTQDTQRKPLHCKRYDRSADSAGTGYCGSAPHICGDSIVIVYNYSDESKEITELDGLSEMQIRGYLTVDSAEEVLLDGGLKMPAYSIAFLTGKYYGGNYGYNA